MSKNNLRRINFVRGPIWVIHSLTLIISCHSKEPLHEICEETPVVAYRRSQNLRDFLARAEASNRHSTQPFFGHFPLQLQTRMSHLPTH